MPFRHVRFMEALSLEHCASGVRQSGGYWKIAACCGFFVAGEGGRVFDPWYTEYVPLAREHS